MSDKNAPGQAKQQKKVVLVAYSNAQFKTAQQALDANELNRFAPVAESEQRFCDHILKGFARGLFFATRDIHSNKPTSSIALLMIDGSGDPAQSSIYDLMDDEVYFIWLGLFSEDAIRSAQADYPKLIDGAVLSPMQTKAATLAKQLAENVIKADILMEPEDDPEWVASREKAEKTLLDIQVFLQELSC